MSVGPAKGQVRFVANLVCQKERITFDSLCSKMSDGTTISDADVAAVLFKLRRVLGEYCSLGYIVDAGPLGTFRPSIRSRVVETEKEFSPSEHVTRTQILFTPRPEFRNLRSVEFHRIAPGAALPTGTTGAPQTTPPVPGGGVQGNPGQPEEEDGF